VNVPAMGRGCSDAAGGEEGLSLGCSGHILVLGVFLLQQRLVSQGGGALVSHGSPHAVWLGHGAAAP